MKDPEELLNRVFTLVRRGSHSVPSEPPFGMQTAVIAHWNASREEHGTATWLLRLRWAALVACGLALLTGVLRREELTGLSSRFDPETRIVESTIQVPFANE